MLRGIIVYRSNFFLIPSKEYYKADTLHFPLGNISYIPNMFDAALQLKSNFFRIKFSCHII